MGSRTRIRWVNVARLAAGAVGCAALVVGLPALLERPKPPPPPDDIGLAHARQAPPQPPRSSPRVVHPAKHRPKETDPEPEPRHAHHQERASHDHERISHDHERPSRYPAPAPVPAPEPAAAAPRASSFTRALRPARPRSRPRRDELALPSSQLVAGGGGAAAKRTLGIRLRALTNDRRETHVMKRRIVAVPALLAATTLALIAPAAARAGVYRAAVCNPALGAFHQDAVFARTSHRLRPRCVVRRRSGRADRPPRGKRDGSRALGRLVGARTARHGHLPSGCQRRRAGGPAAMSLSS